MAANLWTDGPPTIEQIELYLCRDVYGCLPSQLAKEDAAVILRHLTVIDIEGQVKKANNRFK